MLAKDLKVGEYGIITSSPYKGITIRKSKYGIHSIISGSYWNNDILIYEVEKLENVKITWDGCKSEYPRIMMVSDNNKVWVRRNIMCKYDTLFVSTTGTKICDDTGKSFHSIEYWKFAKEIETEKELVHLTLEDISNGLGVGVNPELIRIKK